VDRSDHISVILNPAASGGRGNRIQPKLEIGLKERGLSFTLHRTESPGHARVLAKKAAADGVGALLVVGGDGTLHEAVNGMLGCDSPPPLGVIPVGTGNDFYRMVSHSRALDTALDTIQAGCVRHFDVGRVRFGDQESFFVNLLGMGVDVEVLRKRKGFPWLTGLPQYLAAVVSALASFNPPGIRVAYWEGISEDDKKIVEDRTILMAVTVGPSVAGGFLLNPEASPYDGLLDLFFVEPLGMFKLARYIPKVIRGRHQGVPELLQRRIMKATVERQDGEPFLFEMDGEVMEDPVSRLELEVCPGIPPVLVGQVGP
jgi:diacylglycerol kinase (ATP)